MDIHFLGLTGLGVLVGKTVQRQVQGIGYVPHQLAHQAADTGKYHRKTNELRGAHALSEGQSAGGADVSGVAKIPGNGAAGGYIAHIHDLQGDTHHHGGTHVSHDEAHNKGSNQRTAQAVPADGVAHNGTDGAQINKQCD